MQFTSPLFVPSNNAAQPVLGWRGAWLGILGGGLLLSFTALPNSYTLMVSWPYCLWWQGAFLLLVSWSIWASRQFAQPLTLLGHHLDWVVLFVLVGSTLSTLSSQFRAVAATNLLLMGGYAIVLYLCVNWLRQWPALKTNVWRSLVVISTLTCGVGLAHWRPSAQMWSGQSFYSAIRNPWPLGHHNFVGGYCLLLLPMVVGFTLSQSRWQRWIGVLAIVINVSALYISGSRGALLGLLALCVVSVFFYWVCHPQKNKKHQAIIGLLGLALVAMLASNPRVRALSTTYSFSAHSTLSIENIADSPTKDRLFMLQAGQNIFQKHPFLGVGPGNLSRVYNLYRPLQAGGGLDVVQQLHNTPVQLLAELGLLGFSGYVLWLAALLKLGLSLHRTINNRTDRILLYSIGASWFAYSISSLTDYQLENIGIASTLTITSALFIYLANIYLPPSSVILTPKSRRLASLGLLLYLSIAVQFWARADVGLYLSTVAQQHQQSLDLAAADAKWTAAAQLVPWDPTYSALSADQLIATLPDITDADASQRLSSAAIASLKSALKAAPNDSFFNQNLAVLLLPTEAAQAEQYMRHTVRLFPRSRHYSYYTLGCTLLMQGQNTKATTAFALESITNPQFLIDPLWQQSQFSELLPAVLTQTLSTWQSLLPTTASQSSQHAWLVHHLVLMQWWYRQPSDLLLQSQSPFLQALFQTDSNAEFALDSINNVDKTALKSLLLKAWLAPELHLDALLEKIESTPEEKQLLQENISKHRDIRKWLISVYHPLTAPQRFGLSFSYRNANANSIRSVLFAPGPQSLPLIEQLAIFSSPPREFLQLDQKIAEIGTQQLSLTFPT